MMFATKTFFLLMLEIEYVRYIEIVGLFALHEIPKYFCT